MGRGVGQQEREASAGPGVPGNWVFIEGKVWCAMWGQERTMGLGEKRKGAEYQKIEQGPWQVNGGPKEGVLKSSI